MAEQMIEEPLQAMQGLDEEDSTVLEIVSKDAQVFQVDRKIALISSLIKTAVESDPDAKEVAIPAVASDIMELVISYMKHHNGSEPPIIEKPLRSKVMKEVCKDPFDATFIDDIGENRQQLYDLILAANYMHVNSLLHLGCAKVASLIKGQPLEKIKDILNQGSRGPRVYSKADDQEEEKKE